jgi:rod shape-determining protein MreD
MRRAAITMLMVMAVMLQLSFLPGLRPFGVVPNLALAMTVLVAIGAPTSEALLAAALSGFILDIAGGANFGLWTGVLMIITLVAGLLDRAGFELDRLIVVIGLMVAGTLMISLVILGTLAGRLGTLPLLGVIGGLAWELVINLMIVMALKPGVHRLLSGGRLQTGSRG